MGVAVKPSVLVVDDEPLMRKLVRTIPERSGMEVFDAGSGVEARDVVEAKGDQIGLVLTDVVMPGMDGIELAEYLHSRDPETPVLFMTAYANRLKDAPGPVVRKPFTSAMLVQAVQQMLPMGGSR